MESMIRNQDFAAKLALSYAEFYDGISPRRQRVSLRVMGDQLELRNVETQNATNWSFAKMRVVGDQAKEDTFTFAPDDRGDARLVVSEFAALKAIFEAAPDMPTLSGPSGQWRIALGLAALAVASFCGILFGLIPFMADRAARAIPQDTEIAMGDELYRQIYLGQGFTGLGLAQYECRSPAGVAALDRMVERLAGDVSLPVPLTVRVVQTPMVNATALPGGHVTIHSALIEQAESAEEVAAVLAHEIGHVAHRDPTRGTLRALGSVGLVSLAFGDVTGGTGIAALGSAVIDSSYSREAERRADEYSHRMMEEAGLSPAALGVFFQRMRVQMGDADAGVLEYISSHPGTSGRIEAAEAAAADVRTGPPVLTDIEWQALRNICSTSATMPVEGGGKG